jgi:hypothetical protein
MRLDRLGTSCALAALALAVGALTFAVGCGGGQAETPSPKTATTSAPLPTADSAAASTDMPTEAVPAGSIPRSRVDKALDAGLGAFLQHVVLDDSPVMIDGKFHGFRIDELKGAMFKDVDLKPGDVVTHVNGFPIERPEQAMEAFSSLAVSSELRVDYDRDGKPRELRYPIVDDGPPPAAPGSPATAGTNGQAQGAATTAGPTAPAKSTSKAPATHTIH